MWYLKERRPFQNCVLDRVHSKYLFLPGICGEEDNGHNGFGQKSKKYDNKEPSYV